MTKEQMRKRTIKQPTLCWDCANATDYRKCPWAGGKPRDDWEATETSLDWSDCEGRDHKITSYIVTSCPGFKEG